MKSSTATMPSAKPRINVVLDEDLKAKFERLCFLERRSMSNKLLTMIENEVKNAEEKGILENETSLKTQ